MKAWNVMGGEIKWDALEFVTDMLGIEDVETFVAELVTMNMYQNRDKEADVHA